MPKKRKMKKGQELIINNETYYFIEERKVKKDNICVLSDSDGNLFGAKATQIELIGYDNVELLDDIHDIHICKKCKSSVIFNKNNSILCENCK